MAVDLNGRLVPLLPNPGNIAAVGQLKPYSSGNVNVRLCRKEWRSEIAELVWA
jgi:hypothetical protein